MNSENKYSVKAFLKGFHKVEVGQKIANCEFGFDSNRSQYFLSTIVSADSMKEAKRKGESRLFQVLSVFVVYTGIYYSISTIGVDQISGEQPFLHSGEVILGRLTYLPISKEKIEEIGKLVMLLDKLPSQEQSTKRVDRAINYFLKGCFFETQKGEYVRAESFLNFYKAVEIISHDFRKSFDKKVSGQLETTLLTDITEKEIEKLRTTKRLIQFMCKKLGITNVCDISRIVELRNEFSAHASLEEVNVSKKEIDDCKTLAAKTIMKYADHIKRSPLDSPAL
jgi:hypothetical protein